MPRIPRGIPLRLLLLVTLGLSSAACEVAEVAPDPPAPPPRATTSAAASRGTRPLRVLFAGCKEAGPEPSCTLASPRRPLTLWVDASSPRAVQITLDDVPVDATPEPAEDGLRWTLDVPSGARRLAVHDAMAPAEPPFVLALHEPSAVAPALLLTIEHAARRDGARARARFDRERSRWRGVDQVFAQWVDGSLAWKAGDIPAVRRAYAEGLPLARTHHRWTLADRMAQALAFSSIAERDFDGARRQLERHRTLLPFPTPDHQYLQGLLAEYRGDLGEAQRAYHHALHDARALGTGMTPLVQLAALGQATLLMARTGDRSGAIEQIRTGMDLAASVQPRHRASFFNTAAWALLVSDHPGAPPSPYQPRELLDRARALLGEQPAGEDTWFTVRLNLAYDALARGETAPAHRWLATLDGHRLTRANDLWHRLLLARLERQEGALEPARRRLQAMLADAERHHDLDLSWVARVEHGRVLEQLAQIPAALAEYAAADQILEQQLPVLGLGDREAFTIDREVATHRRVALLTAQGDDRSALCVARLARTRALRAIDQRLRRDADPTTRRAFDDYLGTRLRLDAEYDATFWEPSDTATRGRREIQRARERNTQDFEAIMRRQGRWPPPVPGCDALPRPPAGTLDLHYVRLDSGWVSFAMDDQGTVTRHPLGPVPPWSGPHDDARLGQTLLEPFAPELRDAERVRIMATTELHPVPIHALPFGPSGQRLYDRLPVVYGLDLPRAAAPPRPDAGSALVLEPPSNLPRARQEARQSALALRERGVAVEWLGGPEAPFDPDRPLAAEALAALTRAAWFHYVGHARSEARGGWDGELRLAADGTASIRVADVLSLPAVPHAVILSGCETGVVDPRSQGGGMSLAHAFVLAGAGTVVATTEAVRDDDAIALIDDLYRALPGSALGPDALPLALRSALQRAAARPSAAPPGQEAWRLVRAWVP